jgi:UDP-N-acetylglucosamine 2-epimerase
MKKLKVITIVGTRPEIIKLSRVMNELEQHTNHILIHTGQNYDKELNDIFFSDLGVKTPDYYLDAAVESAAETIGNIITAADKVFEKEKPDALLLLGDTNSCLGAIAAKRRKIPIFHMEAGNRSFDERVPEEINRRIIDHISDINMPYTEHARNYLTREGLKPNQVIKTGSPTPEVLNHYKLEIEASPVLSDMGLQEKNYFVVSVHREENVDCEQHLLKILETLNTLADTYQKKIIVSTHPRTRKRLEALGDRFQANNLVKFMQPMGLFAYVKLQKHAYCVVSDSGTITEESSILGFPAVTIRQSHERPEGMEVGTLLMSGLDYENVLSCVEIAVSHYEGNDRPFQTVSDYTELNVSKKVLRIIMSYTDYINRNTWKKDTITPSRQVNEDTVTC